MHNDGIFSRDFGAHIVGKDGQPRQVHLDKHEFYHGHLHGEGTHTKSRAYTNPLTCTRQEWRKPIEGGWGLLGGGV